MAVFKRRHSVARTQANSPGSRARTWLAGVVLGPALLASSSPDIATADSHVRYLSGLLLVLGLVAWSLLPRMETAGAALRILTAIVFVGGFARLLSLMLAGFPSWPMLGGLVMEVGVTPALAIWQWRLSQKLGLTPPK